MKIRMQIPSSRSIAIALLFAGLVSVSAASTIILDFSATGGSILDATGQATGFTDRLPGTGGSIPTNDTLLSLDTGAGTLSLTSTQSDVNGGAGFAIMSAPALRLSSAGFTGAEDFSVTAVFRPLPAVEFIDQIGLFVGENGSNLTRAGIITFGTPEYFSAHTQSGSDNSGRFFGFGFNGSAGMTVTISRTAGEWQYVINGQVWNPNTEGDGTGTKVNPVYLNGLPDLFVGFYAITPLNSNPKVVTLDSFELTVIPEPATFAALLGGLAAAGALAWRRRRS
jgi:arabinan endo-1,5-alpha-L-arabinosidase